MLRGKELVPGESGPWGGHGGDGALAGCGGRAVTVPGSCLIIPFSIWALRVLGGDSECFLFLEGCGGSLGSRGKYLGAGSPFLSLLLCSADPFPLSTISAGNARQEDTSHRRPSGTFLVLCHSVSLSLSLSVPVLKTLCHSLIPTPMESRRAGVCAFTEHLCHIQHSAIVTFKNLRIPVSREKGTGVWIEDSVPVSSLGSALY